MAYTIEQIRQALKMTFFRKGEFCFDEDQDEKIFDSDVSSKFLKNLDGITKSSPKLYVGDTVMPLRGKMALVLGKVVWVSKPGAQVCVEFAPMDSNSNPTTMKLRTKDVRKVRSSA